MELLRAQGQSHRPSRARPRTSQGGRSGARRPVLGQSSRTSSPRNNASWPAECRNGCSGGHGRGGPFPPRHRRCRKGPHAEGGGTPADFQAALTPASGEADGRLYSPASIACSRSRIWRNDVARDRRRVAGFLMGSCVTASSSWRALCFRRSGRCLHAILPLLTGATRTAEVRRCEQEPGSLPTLGDFNLIVCRPGYRPTGPQETHLGDRTARQQQGQFSAGDRPPVPRPLDSTQGSPRRRT